MRSGNQLELAHKNFHLKPASVSSDVSLCKVITIKFNLIQKKTSVNSNQNVRIYTKITTCLPKKESQFNNPKGKKVNPPEAMW